MTVHSSLNISSCSSKILIIFSLLTTVLPLHQQNGQFANANIQDTCIFSQLFQMYFTAVIEMVIEITFTIK